MAEALIAPPHTYSRDTSAQKQGFIIAIDGPVASGKGTIAPLLAERLRGFYLYTGGMYRSVALACIRKGIDLNNPEEVQGVLPVIDIQYDGEKVLLGGEDVTERIKGQDAANGASVVAAFPEVRKDLVKRQQEIAASAIKKGQIVIAEGRDTGTKVFPDAELRIYLTATDEIRARRRLAQYHKQGRGVVFDQVLAEIRERDKRDKNRETDPLPSEPEKLGYFILDDSQMTEEETLEKITQELQRRTLFI